MLVTATKDLAAIRTTAKARVDAEAEAARLKFVTAGSAQALVYRQKYDEAKDCLANFSSQNLPPNGRYPLLDATIGIEGATVLDVADAVVQVAAAWLGVAARIETLRLSAKADIDRASNPADIETASEVSWP